MSLVGSSSQLSSEDYSPHFTAQVPEVGGAPSDIASKVNAPVGASAPFAVGLWLVLSLRTGEFI
jgi:hypothetical protein